MKLISLILASGAVAVATGCATTPAEAPPAPVAPVAPAVPAAPVAPAVPAAPVAPAAPAAAAPAAPAPAAPPESEIYLADLDLKAGKVSAVRNITRNKGYDNQPSFTPGADAVWFVSDRSGSTDVYRYDIGGDRTIQVTSTAQAEFSPTPLPVGAGFSATHVMMPTARGETYTESQQLWRYSVDGKPLAPVLAAGRIGYHAWLDAKRVALFIVGNEARKLDHTLVLADVATGKTTELASKIGRSLGRTPDGKRISFVDKRDPANWMVVAIAPGETRPTPLVATPKGPAGEKESERSEDYVWLPGGGLMMAKDGKLLRWDGKAGAPLREFADLGDLGGAIKRLAVSRDGRRLAFVVQNR